MIANLHALAEQAYEPTGCFVEGHWQTIQLRPDFASNELLNVGVVFFDGKVKAVRLLENFEKFSHLYGEEAEDELRFILSAVRASYVKHNDLSSIGSIELTQPRLARGESPQEVASRLFGAMVTLDGPVHLPARNRARFMNNSQVRSQVFREVRIQAGLFADRFIAEEEAYVVREQNAKHAFDIPLRMGSHFGTVVSAAFTKVENVERALLRASIDLVAAKAMSQQSDAEIFLLRPPRSGNASALRIDNVIDVSVWKLKKAGVTVDVADTPARLAADIVTWADRNAPKRWRGATT